MTQPSSTDSNSSAAACKNDGVYDAAVRPKKDLKFWLIFISMCTCLFLSALELSSVSTALPTIANALDASQFIWVGSAYAIASTAFLPMSGGLAQTFGRRPAVLLSIGLFALGSGISGGAKTMNMLIAGRTIQGLGGGGIQSLTAIVLSDLVTLQERGAYAGLFGLTWSIAAAIGPVVGGSLASRWRWLFYLNLPISFVAGISVLLLLDLPIPPGTFREKAMRMNWLGNFLVISSSVACNIGLTWGGITAPWGSSTVLVPLILGAIGLVGFVFYEAALAKNPLVPFSILTNRTSISGYLQSFFSSLIALCLVYFCPVFFQGCKGASAVQSGIYGLAMSSLAPSAIFGGVSVKVTGRYRPQMWAGWVLLLIGLGFMTTLRSTDAVGRSIGYMVLLGLGIGVEYSTTMYPIQAPLSVTQNASALAFMWFLRSFAGVWGVTIGSAVLQNELSKRLPTTFIQSVPQGTAIMYALIPELPSFPAQTRAEVEVAFAGSLSVLWQVLLGIACVGFLSSLFMQGLVLNNNLDEEWAMREKSQESA